VKYTIDRIEGNFAVCEKFSTKEIVNISLVELPVGIKEGMIIKYENGVYLIDREETNNTANRIREKMNRLWK